MRVDHSRALKRTLLVFFCFRGRSSTELALENSASDSSSLGGAALRLGMARGGECGRQRSRDASRQAVLQTRRGWSRYRGRAG